MWITNIALSTALLIGPGFTVADKMKDLKPEAPHGTPETTNIIADMPGHHGMHYLAWPADGATRIISLPSDITDIIGWPDEWKHKRVATAYPDKNDLYEQFNVEKRASMPSPTTFITAGIPSTPSRIVTNTSTYNITDSRDLLAPGAQTPSERMDFWGGGVGEGTPTRTPTGLIVCAVFLGVIGVFLLIGGTCYGYYRYCWPENPKYARKTDFWVKDPERAPSPLVR